MNNYDTLDSQVAGAYENAASYRQSQIVTSVLGTHAYVESFVEDIDAGGTYEPVSDASLDALIENVSHDYLA